MATLVWRGFGGMAPSARANGLDPSVARYCANLTPRFGDFRPLPLAAQVALAAPGATLYRFETVGGFITRPGVVNFVRGPIPTDATERTYYSGDGAPKVTDNSGQVRALGVPAPAAAPLVAINAVTQYSTDDAAADQGKKLTELIGVLRAGYDWVYTGLSDADLAARFVPGGAPWSYSFRFGGTLVDGNFVPSNPAHAALMDDRLGFHIGPDGLGGEWGFADMNVRGAKIVWKDTLADQLATIRNPLDPASAMLSSDQIASMVDSLGDALKPADAACAAAITALEDLQAKFVALADAGSPAGAANVGAVAAFYQRDNVVGAIDAAVNQAVGSIYNAMLTYNNP